MKRNYYIFNNGRLRRKANTIYLENDEGKKPIPIEDIEALYLFSELDLNTKLLDFLTQNNVPLHTFNHYGFYSGSYYPREYLNSGALLVSQVKHYTTKDKRLRLAREFVRGAAANILRNLKYYNTRKATLTELINTIEQHEQAIETTHDVQELMGTEGRIRERYYQSYNHILEPEEPFEKRVKRPPDNMINTLISFGNALMYTTTLGEIYRTQLNPTISYLHEPGQRRFSLSLDISEIFKPIIIDRTIFKLLNTKMLQEKHLDRDLNYCHLKDEGKKIFIREYDERLKTTIKHRKLNREVSYRRLIRLECYKLIKHIMGIEKYESFRAWW